jgi:hypothetical protein
LKSQRNYFYSKILAKIICSHCGLEISAKWVAKNNLRSYQDTSGRLDDPVLQVQEKRNNVVSRVLGL